MYTVSRTPLPGTPFDAFESLPSQKALDTPIYRVSTFLGSSLAHLFQLFFSQTNESRQSAMSISSDLFPELLSWAAFIDMTKRSHSVSPLPQGMPNDIAEEDDMFDDDMLTESECHHPLSLSRIFDPTTLAMGFDTSHLDGLDEQLIYSPQDAFFDLCWPDDPYPYPSKLEETAETISAPSLPSVSILSSFETDSGLEECQTQVEDTRIRVQQFDGVPPTIKVSSYVSMIAFTTTDWLLTKSAPFLGCRKESSTGLPFQL